MKYRGKMKRFVFLLVFLLVACASLQRQALATPGAMHVVVVGQKIQDCLDKVKPGETCQVASGTYNESLTIKTSGTKSAPITLKCETLRGCTVNSGNARSLVTTGQKGYYVVDGFRFLSTLIDNSHPSKMGTVNLAYNYWGDGFQGEKGNDGFILRNCYVEGSVYFYGSDNLVENCEFNGKGIFANAVIEAYEPSENNTFRNIVCHDYTERCGWSLQLTNNTTWENNEFYNSKEGIDCDGAGYAIGHSESGQPLQVGNRIINNHIHDMHGETGILLENCFNSVVEGNVIHDTVRCIGAINYNVENGDGFSADQDYKPQWTGTVIRNNICYNIADTVFRAAAVRGNQLINNTIYNGSSSGSRGAISFETYTKINSPDWIVRNNLVAQSPKTIFFVDNPSIDMDDNFYSGTFSANIYGTGSRNYSQWQAMGKDVHSKTGDPLFVNASKGDFRLQSGSTACGYGALPCDGITPTPLPATGTPTASRTPTPTPTMTPTATKTPTATPRKTNTPIPSITPTPLPIPEDRCVKVVWDKGGTGICSAGLNLRESDSMSNLGGIGFLCQGHIFKPISIDDHGNGDVFAQYAYYSWIAMDLAKDSNTYAEFVKCPQ